jgi:hypothetical protein
LIRDQRHAGYAHHRGRAVAALNLAVCAGRITGIQLLANPDKLTAIMAGRALPRS